MVSPGWFPDPSSRYQFRWWDGERWTNQVSVNQVISTDPVPLDGPPAQVDTGSRPPVNPAIDNTPDATHQLFTNQVLQVDEVGGHLGVGSFGNFEFSSPGAGLIGTVQRTGRTKRTYTLYTEQGRVVAVLLKTKSQNLVEATVRPGWHLTTPDGHYIGEYVQHQKLGTDMRLAISIGAQQIGEVLSTNARGTKLTIQDPQGVFASIERPKGFFADSLSTKDNYTLTRHRPVGGALAYLALMAPVAIDEARYTRDVRTGG